MILLLVLIGGAAGAAGRYLVSQWSQARFVSRFPWGTVAANVAGALALGLLSGLGAGADGLPAWVRALAGIGFCGALTTYSTFGLETVRLAQAGARRLAVVNVIATVLVGLTACWLGWALARIG